MNQFINAVNAGGKAEANDLLCPKVLGVSQPNIDKVMARQGKMKINPDPRFSDPEHVAIVGTYNNSAAFWATIEFAPYRENDDLCISLFSLHDE